MELLNPETLAIGVFMYEDLFNKFLKESKGRKLIDYCRANQKELSEEFKEKE